MSAKTSADAGAPPRAWGGRRGTCPGWPAGRSTPTCVGRTSCRWAPPPATTEHPHVRGEDPVRVVGHVAGSGAPPRAWGGCLQRRPQGRRHRSTPTCVGRTQTPGATAHLDREHPHVRGEDGDVRARADRRVGAPLRAWGGLPVRRAVRVALRSTPTCVGRTDSDGVLHGPLAEHPHLRGEDRAVVSTVTVTGGAPPRAWGGPLHHVQRNPRIRSTPTCVGRTTGVPEQGDTSTEHPHVRGEDTKRIGLPYAVDGAPPRAWGGRLPPPRLRGAVRSTPTCVGRTRSTTSTRASSTEHPHVRGEDCRGSSRPRPPGGAPPRAWGGRHGPPPRPRALRSTPTCVGRTARGRPRPRR